MIQTNRYGTYHMTNEGECSWADFAREIFAYKDLEVKVNDVTTANYGAKAPRPMNSRLSKDKLEAKGFKRLPTWQEALHHYLDLI